MRIPVIGSAPLPPVVYVPVVQPDDDDPLRYAFVELADGRIGAPVYTALDRLQSAYGLDHAWMLNRVQGIEELVRKGEVDVMIIDHRALSPAPDAAAIAEYRGD